MSKFESYQETGEVAKTSFKRKVLSSQDDSITTIPSITLDGSRTKDQLINDGLIGGGKSLKVKDLCAIELMKPFPMGVMSFNGRNVATQGFIYAIKYVT